MIDNISKFLIEQYSADFAAWLLGEAIALTTINPTELNVEPIRADSVMLPQSSQIILHTEFQTVSDSTMPFRMADYYLRLKRKFPERDIHQVVIYLKPTNSDLVRQTSYQTAVMTHQFRVIRLWEEPLEVFLSTPGLLPYAVLSRATDKERVLAQVLGELEQIADPREQSNLVAATSILAGLELNEQTIRQLMRSPVMRESTMYQAILREGEERGLEQGLEQGLIEGRTVGERELVLKQLTRKLGSLSPQLTATVSNLTLERLEALAEDLLDFTSAADLDSWLD
ncbi:Rpn family recombination-promoting nuclease/putative transposase [Synechocystis sp. PCC 7509]|uniref:Rpn family recombination-promoting nuclease/putative transposase n=1 Tax=Synechocystis sp. PCC 7509 TaxID=927677 RepID=UPI0002AC3F75|nr:Rpn family recombination-promoting nuclease/putative transposase [Synechocystis sp. PCC 7509]